MIPRLGRLSLFGVLCLLAPSSPLFAQFGLGGFDLAPDGGLNRVETHRQARGGSIIIQWSEGNDELAGFSSKSGRWQILKIDPQESIVPVCVELVGAVRLKDGVAAYSGETGTWDVVHLPESSEAMPAVSPDVAVFTEGKHFYTFAASTGRWTSPTDPALTLLAIHYLSPRNIRVTELHEKLVDWMQTVPASDVGGSIQFLDGIVSLLPRTKAWRDAALAEVARVDVPSPDPNAVAGTDAQSGGTIIRQPFAEPLREISSGAPLADGRNDVDAQTANLRRELASLEDAVALDASAARNAGGDNSSQLQTLRILVEKSFDVRQQLQELEVERLKLKLRQVEVNLAIRAKSREALVERRLDELLKGAPQRP
ncbi:MAG: hypothetical protein KF774_07480 [Planctomyces sp.]|nr:hypothetical protein [Planctomyces sp.]